MLHEGQLTSCVLEKLLLLFVTSVPVFSKCCDSALPCSRPHVPLRINVLHVPSPAAAGEIVRMRCGYDLGNETLYAVKWYKDMAEFFRYVPATDPPLKSFKQPGIFVDLSRSDGSSVVVVNASMESTGNYTCQVSTDRPFFRCVQATRPLEVVVPPSDGPVLMEEKSEYELGDNVSILCNSGRAMPAPHLQWYINDQLAQQEAVWGSEERVVWPDRLESSSLGVRFRLQPGVLQDGKVVLKCVARVNHLQAVTIKEIRAAGCKPELHAELILCCFVLIASLNVAHRKLQV